MTRSPGRFGRVAGGIVDHPWLVRGLVVAITSLAAIGYYDPTILLRYLPAADSETVGAADEGERAEEAAPRGETFRPNDADTILVIESPDFFTAEGVRGMRRVVERLESLDYVSSVMWLDRVPILNVFGLPEPILPRDEGSPARLHASRERAMRHPLVAGQLLSHDGRTMLLMVEFDWLFVRDDHDVTTRLANVAREAIEDESGFDATVQVTGRVPLYLAMRASREENQLRYQLVGYAVIAGAALVLFRGPAAVFVVALAPALGVFWTLGILRFFDLQENPFNDVILPTLLSLVGLTDGVHLMVQIRHYRAAGLAATEAARIGATEVGLACFLTSLTTAIGFGSLGLTGHEVVREFGWSCVIGVFLTFVSVMTVIPLACTTFLGRRIHAGHHTGVVQKHLQRIGVIIDWAVAHKRPVAITAFASTLVFTAIAFTLRPDERLQRGLPESSEAVRAIRHMDRVFGGLETARVEIRWDPRGRGDTEEVLHVLHEVHRRLDAEPLIGTPLSLAKLVEALPGSGPEGSRLAMAELLPAPLKRAFYQPDQRRASVQFRVQDVGIARYGPVFTRLEQQFAQIQQRYPGFSITLDGSAVWRWRHLYQIVMDLATSLGTASLIIFVVLGIVYRSVRIGLISVVPNVFPLALTGTVLVWYGQGLEIVSVCAFTVCLGIAVDDTIHFITRYLEQRAETPDSATAIHHAFVGVGTALITTTVVLVAGFSTVLFSDSREHLIFAGMGILTFLSALFADLIFLPALLAWFGPARPRFAQPAGAPLVADDAPAGG